MQTFTRATVEKITHGLERDYYISDSIFDQEVQQIFTKQWLCVGRGEQISQPGDYFLFELFQESILIVRDNVGSAKAFYNFCRHRGTRICTQTFGQFNLNQGIRCPYHAWTYGLDGQLTAARHMREVTGFNLEDYPLKPCALVEWEGFLWLNLAEEPVPFHQTFAPLLGRFAPWRLADLRVAKRIQYELQCNWKLIYQNYSECYHCPLIHPELARLSPYQSGRNDLSAGPFLGGYMGINIGQSLTMTGFTNRPPLPHVTEENLTRAYYYTLMPNLFLSLHPDYAMTHQLLPLAANRTLVVCEWLFDATVMAQTDFDPMDAVAFWDLTNRQDWEVCELTQQGVTSRAFTPGPYANQEGLAAAFDQEYLQRLSLS